MVARLTLSASQWRGWLPGAVDHGDRAPWSTAPELIWRDMSRTALHDPFFQDSFRKAHGTMRRSDWETLAEVASVCEPITPTGFIFHMSRCGSTLVAQMLASSDTNVVLSEVPTIDAILRADVWEPQIDETTQIQRLRHMLAVLGQRRADGQRRLFIKFDAWNIAQLPLVLRAFPDVPWLFLYREPIEVLVSHRKRPGMHMVPGLLKGAPFDPTPEDIGHDEFGPWLLAQVCRAALDNRELGHGGLVDYARLPHFVTTELAAHFGIAFSATEIAQMETAARYDAKAPMNRFEADVTRKQAAATPQLRELAERWLGVVWRSLQQTGDASRKEKHSQTGD